MAKSPTKTGVSKRAPGLTLCDMNRILIVDDEKTIRDLFQRILALRLPTCRIDVAVNGAEAVEEFHEAHQGVIMMDLNMPVMDGHTAFVEIQKLCRAEKIEMPSVIFCTGYEPSDTIKELTEGNSLHCVLNKPVSDTMLIEALRKRLGKHACQPRV